MHKHIGSLLIVDPAFQVNKVAVISRKQSSMCHTRMKLIIPLDNYANFTPLLHNALQFINCHEGKV